jgi:hypothetical protein
MPTPTYTPLATVTLASTAASVTFSSIPATYRDLILVVRGTLTSGVGSIRFNGDSGANYTRVGMYGDGSTAASYSGTSAEIFNSPITDIMNIMDYSATDKHKTYIARDSNSASLVVAQAGRWANTAAITTVALISPSSTFGVGSTFSLYGVIA